MSTYSNNRRGPNMSQYIANLNTDTPPTEDLFAGAQDDLSLFASTEFFDWDMNFDASESGNFETNTVDKKPSTAGWQPSTGTSGNQFSLDADFNFTELNSFNSIAAGSTNNGLNFSLNNGQSGITSPASATSPTSAAPRVGDKRKSITTDGDNARVAAEEDKRRRNTAASARFRVKKKQREQALEKTAKEMTERAQMLETKVQQLEMENKWLKGLITEREVGGESKVQGVVTKGALDELFEKYKRDERSKSSDADGELDD